MIQLQPKLLTDTWVKATWEDFLRLVENPTYALLLRQSLHISAAQQCMSVL